MPGSWLEPMRDKLRLRFCFWVGVGLVLLGLDLAAAGSGASAYPGWLGYRQCAVMGDAMAAAGSSSADSSMRVDSVSHLDSVALAGLASGNIRDTLLAPPGGFGSKPRMQVTRNGIPLLAEQDYLFLGDSAWILAEPLRAGDTLCATTYGSRFFIAEPWVLRRFDEVPAWDSTARSNYRRGEASLDSMMAQPLDVFAQSERGLGSGASLGGSSAGESAGEPAYRLDFTGSKSMAVSVGEGGGLGLDATLLLEVKGQLAENVFVEGRLSDQNVPLQPEGNTATLKELDTKYMRIYGRNYDATLGDYELKQGVAGVDAVNARVSGLRGAYRGEVANHRFGVQAALAQTQGIFSSDTLRGVDGKQRGYYLRGRDGRIFIRVLPGTETVWRNGSKLGRGSDYTIDYSEGRIDFLNRVAVSSENLFAIEFEYAEEDYPRTLMSLGGQDSIGHWRLGLRALRLQEDEGNPLGAASDSALRLRLAEAGDRPFSDSAGGLVRAPESRAIEVVDLAYHRDSVHRSVSHAAFSQRDANLYSSRDDEDNQGFATHYRGEQVLGKTWDRAGFGEWRAAWLHDHKSLDYRAFNSWVEPRGFRDLWNLDATTGERGFTAHRGLLAYRPYRHMQVTGELGRADGKVFADSTGAPYASSESQRMGWSAEWKPANAVRAGSDGLFESLTGPSLSGGVGDRGLRVSSEAKLARSPERRDNYRQQAQAAYALGPLKPVVTFDRNEWLTDANQTVQWQPAGRMQWQTPVEAMQLESGLEAVIWQSRFDGRLPSLSDSARLLHFDQRLQFSGWGPLGADALYRFQQREVFTLTADNDRASTPQRDDFHLFEGNVRYNRYRQGFTASTGYKVQRTAELPLIDDYRKVDAGRGQYVYDDSLKSFHEVETGGDYVLVGLRRDTSLTTRPYQDVQWSADFELAPGRFPFRVKGILADLELSGQVAADLQDSGSAPPFFPAFGEGGIRAARSGRLRFQPQLRWNHPDGRKQWTFQVLREFSKSSGLYAAEDGRLDYEAVGRHTYAEVWEATLTSRLQNHERRSSTSTNRSQQDGLSFEGRLQKRFAGDYVGAASLTYQQQEGDAVSGPYDLQGWRPGLRLEKAFPSRGRAFAAYDLQHWGGQGQGDYYALGGYSKGITHRFEASADFTLQTYLYLHLNYLVRYEPEATLSGNRWVQRLNAEIRAVF